MNQPRPSGARKASDRGAKRGLRSIIRRPPRKPRTPSAGGQAACRLAGGTSRRDFRRKKVRLKFLARPADRTSGTCRPRNHQVAREEHFREAERGFAHRGCAGRAGSSAATSQPTEFRQHDPSRRRAATGGARPRPPASSPETCASSQAGVAHWDRRPRQAALAVGTPGAPQRAPLCVARRRP